MYVVECLLQRIYALRGLWERTLYALTGVSERTLGIFVDNAWYPMNIWYEMLLYHLLYDFVPSLRISAGYCPQCSPHCNCIIEKLNFNFCKIRLFLLQQMNTAILHQYLTYLQNSFCIACVIGSIFISMTQYWMIWTSRRMNQPMFIEVIAANLNEIH